MAATMTARTAAGTVTAVMAASRPLPSALQTALYIIPTALPPAPPALHQFIEARQDTEVISTVMVTEKPVNKAAPQPLLSATTPCGVEAL